VRLCFKEKMIVGTLALVGLLLPAAANAQVSGLTVSTGPALYPAFEPGVSDYVTRCTGTPVNVSVSAQPGTGVGVDGQGATSGDFSVPVSITPGQAFRITASDGTESATYYVRCLPSDFPNWTFQRSGQPQAEWYLVAPVNQPYHAIFDQNGVPVWWFRAAQGSLDFKLLPDGNLALAYNNSTSGIDERRLDGSLVRNLHAVAATTDPHEVLLLPNGNYLVLTQRTVDGQTA
jgi:hypothetical protein